MGLGQATLCANNAMRVCDADLNYTNEQADQKAAWDHCHNATGPAAEGLSKEHD